MLHCPICGKQYPIGVLVCPADNTLLQADETIFEVNPTTAGDIDPLLGQTLDDKYRLEARLGNGGMGTVYRGRHVFIDRPVAIKVLNPRFGEDEAARERFRREARASGRLQHDNAVTVTDFGETSAGFVYIVMELLEGRTLREIIAKEAPLEIARSVSILLQASAAVAAAHEAGIIHRDLKPANIFIVQKSEAPVIVKVLDFGIAKLAVDSFDEEDVKALTQIGARIGTPRYMSPEQCDGLELTEAADVYSLGVILYEMLTGVTPFTGSTPLAIAMKHATAPPRSPREIVAAIPEALERVVLQALEKQPDRSPDAGAFRRQLLETADSLGLEHAALTSAPDLKVLRDLGTQSPSGRLVIDISRLRERRVLAGTDDLTLVSEAGRCGDVDGNGQNRPGGDARQPVPSSISIPARSKRTLLMAVLGLLGVFGLSLGIAILLFVLKRTETAPTLPNTNSEAISSPTAAPSPSPVNSPALSPSPSPEREASKLKQTKKIQKKEDNSLLGKVKRIFKKEKHHL